MTQATDAITYGRTAALGPFVILQATDTRGARPVLLFEQERPVCCGYGPGDANPLAFVAIFDDWEAALADLRLYAAGHRRCSCRAY